MQGELHANYRLFLQNRNNHAKLKELFTGQKLDEISKFAQKEEKLQRGCLKYGFNYEEPSDDVSDFNRIARISANIRYHDKK